MADEIDPNASLFGGDEPEADPQEAFLKQVFGNNPNRTSALSDLLYKEMIESIDEDDLPEEAKRQMIFKMTANSVLDIIMESLSPDLAEEVSLNLDGFLGVALVNKRFNVDLYAELEKAVAAKTKDIEDEEQAVKAETELGDQWWTIPQPKLDMRTPNDAVVEILRKYGLEV